MRPIAIWYHCKLSGTGIPSEDYAISVMYEQMAALKSSGLADAAAEIHAGVNGGNGDALTVCSLLPERIKQTFVHAHGHAKRSELPTFSMLLQWLPTHADWFVLYHHSKGVTQLEQGIPNVAHKDNHRRVMEGFVVWEWRRCVQDLERGYDAVGCNWVDPIVRPFGQDVRMFAGNFWWAKASYLMTLPPMPDNAPNFDTPTRTLAERWIGSGRKRTMVLDYQFPHLSAWCQQHIKP